MRTARRPGRPCRGFTLLELMVVLVIVATLAGFAVLAVGDGGRGRMVEEAVRSLEARMTLARDEAILLGRETAVGFHQAGYTFLHRVMVDDRTLEWRPLQEDRLLRPRHLGDLGLELELRVEGLPVALERDPEHPDAHIVLGSDGMMTPFQLRVLDSQGRDALYILRGRADGRLRIQRPGEAS
ncbi:type II secretion system minor pseudopilin GspH [Ectothiorhodospira mobilis]|uniref:type II secretion system minor pseudopilin GspH n=1 Tax=Ectothiorhodospira mobilis TaxID=195064 RepID=UPI001EE91F1A|nr:type II secretion system minor pseudopilin GspH [Ectothiorhodospira mobilis]